MKKIICIGECSLNIILGDNGQPLSSMPGGRVVNAASMLAQKGYKVLMASEAAADPIGDIIAAYLLDSGVDITSLDRFTEGRTPINLFTSTGSTASITRYESYPKECFDIIWPRVEEGDVVLFGGYYTLDSRMRERLIRFLSHCDERKAVLIYLPGFLPQQEPRITRVMPALLENLEFADIVVVRDNDLKMLFGTDNPETAYHAHVDFYCRSLVCVDAVNENIIYYSGREVSAIKIPVDTSRTMLWNSGAIAGVVSAVIENSIGPDSFDMPSVSLREAILNSALCFASDAVCSLSDKWQYIN